MKITHHADYREKRKSEYPPLTEFADALYWANRGDGAPLTAYLARVDEIKQRYPKPAQRDGEE